MSALLQRHDLADRAGQTVPVGRLLRELFAAQPRQGIKLRATSQLAGLPFRRDPAFLLQLMKRRIKGAVADAENVGGTLFQALADRPAVERLKCQNLQK